MRISSTSFICGKSKRGFNKNRPPLSAGGEKNLQIIPHSEKPFVFQIGIFIAAS